MKILFIAPDGATIPPKGHGAIESIIHDYRLGLSKLGHEVLVHQGSRFDTFKLLSHSFNPDVCYSHCYYGVYRQFLHYSKAKLKFATNHFGDFYEYIQLKKLRDLSGYNNTFNIEDLPIPEDINFICLSQEILDYHHDFYGINHSRLFLIPNRIYPNNFNYLPTNKFSRSVCLGEMSDRKRQYLLKDSNVDCISNKSKRWIHNNLCNYSNGILISSSEAASLSVLEYLMAGLGIVLSNACTYNLDLNLNFIDVIPEDDLKSIQLYIKENINKSNTLRKEIRDYAETFFDFNLTIKQFIQICN